MLGWVLDVHRLADWDGDGITIQPNACVASILCGAGVLLLLLKRRRAAATAGLLAAAIGVTALVQYATGVRLTVLNTFLMFGRTWGRVGVLDPGRMGPPGALCWALLGIALAIAGSARSPRARRVVPRLGVAALAVAALSITGYLYGASTLYSLPHATVIALQTSTFIVAAALGVLAAVPEEVRLTWLFDPGTTARVARRAVLVVVLVPLALGWLLVRGEAMGLYDSRFGIGTYVVVVIAFLLAVVALSLSAIGRHEADLRAADRRKDEFLATLAHELRGPLAPLRYALDLLGRAGGDEARERGARETMRRQLAHMVRLIDDLLDVARVTRDALELRRERVPLRRVVDEALESAAPFAAERRHTLAVTLPDEPVLLDADPARLVQIIGNLLHNACKYTPPGGRISLTAERDGGEAVLRVTDDGVGLAPAQLATVFQPFTRIARAGAPSGDGLGIGLHLAKRLVEMHGGSVVAHSDGPDRGCTFVVRLPALPAEASESPAAAAPPPGTVVRRCLVVDDDYDSVTGLAELLRESGCEVRTALDGAAALAQAEDFRPDTVLLDVGLPGMSGLEACRRIREQPWGKDVLLIALTGFGQNEDRLRSEAAGFDHHFVKPVDFDALLARLSDAGTRTAGPGRAARG
jgi:signal transduction histidine kinase/ActR/RegA family two-component response regulator